MTDATTPPATPWLTGAEGVARALDTDPSAGLSSDEASARLRRFGPNRLEPKPPVPAWRRFAAQFADPLVYLLLGATAISVVTWAVEGAHGLPFEAIVIGAILVANAGLGFWQEARAEHAVAALERLAAPESTVLRDGVQRRVPFAELVPGDVLVLAEGDAVGADGRLVEAAALTVAEASLTGESEPVAKHVAPLSGAVALGDRVNMVFGGTAVTRGRGRAVVTTTGMATEIGRIATLLGETEEERTPLQREIATVGRWLGIAVLAIAAVVVAAILVTEGVHSLRGVVDILLIGVSLAVAAVPEGLPAIMSVVLALGVQRMAGEHAIVKQLTSVETLGSATAICSDKTGTLTQNEMAVARILTRSGEVEVATDRPSGEEHPDAVDAFRTAEGPLRAGELLEEVRTVLEIGALANDASLAGGDGGTAHGDPTEVAFLVAERRAPFVRRLRDRFTRVGEIPFTSERKLMSTLQSTADGGRYLATKGAPDVLLARCAQERVGDGVRPLDAARRREILAGVESLADRAYRTRGPSSQTLPPTTRPVGAREDGGLPPEELERDLVFCGVVGMIDPPRPEARRAIEDAASAGIRVVMITGDHPRTAARIAADLGIAGVDAPVVTGPDIEAFDDDALREHARLTPVYARVAPEHKLRIVDALQADGHVVAMTGDGVNDAPALKRADIGVAMGIAGTDVAKEAANMVLADDNFATIVAAVREGRGIFSNIRKFLRYLLSSNAGEVLTMFLGVVGAGVIGLRTPGGEAAVPLLATQILWINLLTDAAPALAMGVDPPPDDVMSRQPRRLTDRVIDRPMQRGILFVGLVMALATLFTIDLTLPGGLFEGSGTLAEARTMAFTTLVLAQLFNCFNARSEWASAFEHLFTNAALWGAVALSVALQLAVVYLPFLHRPFHTVSLTGGEWGLCTVMASTVLWANEARKIVIRRRAAAGGRHPATHVAHRPPRAA